MKLPNYTGPVLDATRYVSEPNNPETKQQILDILARGKVVRFSRPGFWKDVREFNPDKDHDLVAFRVSDGCLSQYVCWDSDLYAIEEVDP